MAYRHNESMLAESQINILTDTYWRLYDAWFVREELQQVFLERGESQYWIYKVLVKCQGQILEDGRDGYRAEMLYNQNRDLYDHLQKHCFFVKKKEQFIQHDCTLDIMMIIQ